MLIAAMRRLAVRYIIGSIQLLKPRRRSLYVALSIRHRNSNDSTAILSAVAVTLERRKFGESARRFNQYECKAGPFLLRFAIPVVVE